MPDRAVVTESEVLLQFDVMLTNSGVGAGARRAGRGASWFRPMPARTRKSPPSSSSRRPTGDRMAGIPPLGQVSLKSAVRLPLDQLHSFEVEGRRLFVPLVAFNILFRSGGGRGPGLGQLPRRPRQ